MSFLVTPNLVSASPRFCPPHVSAYVQIVGNVAQLEEHVLAWEELCSEAIEPNVFYEPWMLMPALKAFAKDQLFGIALVYARASGENGRPLLCGLFPLQRSNHYRKVPFAVFQLWSHIHCFLRTPLVRAGFEDACLRSLFTWISQNPHLPQLFEFGGVAGDGPFWHCLVNNLSQMGCPWIETEQHQRAFLTNPVDSEDYFKQAMTSGNRKELRRQRRRLGEIGALEFTELEDEGELDNWIGQFLILERKGWKGARQTALLQCRRQERFFRTICRNAFNRHQLMLLKLTLGGQPIAMKCNFVSGDGLFTFKITYDESLAKYSPGVQLELDNIRHASSRADLLWMDSCAEADHFMINRLWNERRTIRTALASTGGVCGRMFVKGLPWLRRLRRRFRQSQPEQHS